MGRDSKSHRSHHEDNHGSRWIFNEEASKNASDSCHSHQNVRDDDSPADCPTFRSLTKFIANIPLVGAHRFHSVNQEPVSGAGVDFDDSPTATVVVGIVGRILSDLDPVAKLELRFWNLTEKCTFGNHLPNYTAFFRRV